MTDLLERTFRDHSGRVLAALIGYLGDIDLAEEAAQEAFAIAAERWPRDGTPVNPAGWLVATARNRAIDRIRDERGELAEEAIRLGGALAELMPDEPEVWGLLALMSLHDSRRAARRRDGEIVLLSDQDRKLWDGARIRDGRVALARALALHGRGPYTLQAAIASLHAEPETDWARILALYEELAQVSGSPVVELNRAVALAEVDGPEAGLRAIDRIGALDTYQYLHAARADLLRRLDRPVEARAAYGRALELAHTDPERRFLAGRIAEL